MRQKGDFIFIDLLNKVRAGNIDSNDKNLLKSKIFMKDDSRYQTDAIHIWAEKNPVEKHNINLSLHSINATDTLPKNVTATLINKALARSQMQTGGLAKPLLFKVNAKVMLTSDIDFLEKLTNGQIGKVFGIKVDDNQNVSIIYIYLFCD